MPLGERTTARNGRHTKSNMNSAPAGLSRDTATPHNASSIVNRITQLQRHVGNRAVLQMLRASGPGHSPSADGVIQRAPSYRLPKEDNKDEFDEYEKSSFSDIELEDMEGSDGKFTAVQADKKLPTYLGALKRIFGEDNVNIKKFAGTSKVLGDAADRPHSVTANIDMTTTNKDPRENGPLATAIGHFGYEQLDIQEGVGLDRVMDYNGGHLVGYQVLGGEKADQEWNIAPQDENNNKFAYNNTIEEMARTAKLNTNFDYTVELKYSSPNFEVDQNQLVKHGYLKKQDESKPWTIQLPTRIPQHWSAKAIMNGDTGSFGSPTLNDPKKPKKTYEQLSQNLESELAHDDSTHTARYKLTYEDSSQKDIPGTDVKKRLSDIRSVHFRMHQEQPKNINKLAMPDDWKGEEKSDFGSVEKEKITAELVLKLRDDIEQELLQLDSITEESETEFDFKKLYEDQLTEITEMEGIDDTSKKQQIISFGMQVQSQRDMFIDLKFQHEECERMRSIVFEQKKQLKQVKQYRKKREDKTVFSTLEPEELIQEAEEMNTHSLTIKRTKVSLDNYNKSVKKRKLDEEEVKQQLVRIKKQATSKHEAIMKEESTRKSMPSVFSGQRLSTMDKKPVDFYLNTVQNFFKDFPAFTKQDGPGIKDFMKIEDEDEEQNDDEQKDDEKK